jgi:hypothetical protein
MSDLLTISPSREMGAAPEGGAITTREQVDWIYREGYKPVLAEMRRAGQLAACPCETCSMHDGLP